MTDHDQESSPPTEAPDGAIAGGSIVREALRLASRSDAFASSWIFGSPVEHGGVVVIPLGRMRGGAGGGGGRGVGPADRDAGAIPSDEWQGPDSGVGAGWGVDARALGAIVIRGDRVRYIPAVDVTRIVSVSMMGMAVAAVLAPRILRAARRRD